jgi:arylsulfatase
MIVSWPRQIQASGELRHQYLHAIDIVPTLYDCLGITPPDQVKGYEQTPIHGASFRATFEDASAPNPRDTQFYGVLGTRGIWRDGWLANTVHPPMPSAWGHYEDDEWELYNLEADRNQMHNLADEHPEKLEELKRLWFAEAEQYNGLPLEDRSAAEYLPTVEDKPRISPPSDRQVLYPGTAEVPEHVALQYFGRSFSIMAEVDLRSPEAEGVLFAHGGRFGGHSLYIKDGTLHYVYNWLGKEEQRIVSPDKVPGGRHILGVRFEAEGRDGVSPTGTVTMYVDDDAVASDQIKIQLGHFTITGEGLNAGRDSSQPVSSEYESPFAFTGGTIKEVVLDRSGAPYTDMERQLAAAFARD